MRGAIRRVDRDGAERAFTGGTNDRLPRVAPDGSAVAFVADRDGKARLLVLRLDGGEATPLGGEFVKISAVAWSPDAKRIAFVATAPFDEVSARVFHDEKTGARHIRMLPFKSDADGLLRHGASQVPGRVGASQPLRRKGLTGKVPSGLNCSEKKPSSSSASCKPRCAGWPSTSA